MITTPAVADKKTIFGWAMYDFANSSFTTLTVTFIYATYFIKAIAPDELSGTLYWSRAVTISALAVAVLSPILGGLADQKKCRKLFLIISSVIAITFSALLYFPLPGQVLEALVAFIVANIAFEMGGVFYNAFLPEIAPVAKMGRFSGLGWGLGYAGGLAAMLVAMITLVNPEIPWFGFTKDFGQNIRATNLLVALWFAIFSIPTFLFVNQIKAAPKNQKSPTILDVKGTFKEILRYPRIARFLVARLIYNDGLITIFAFGGIYAAGTFNFTFQEIMIFGIVLNLAAGLGAFGFGFCDDKLGGRNTILISLAGLIIASLLAILTESRMVFWLAGVLVGIFSGPNQSASRSLMARMIPEGKEGQFFGFFAFSGKFTAFLGPLLLGIITDIFASQRAGMAVVLAFFLTGAFIMLGLDDNT